MIGFLHFLFYCFKKVDAKRSLLCIFCMVMSNADAQHSISGKVVNLQTQKPVEFAMVSIAASGLWASADTNGDFVIKNIPAGKVTLTVQYLGYVKKDYEYVIIRNLNGLVLQLEEDNLTLNQVEVTAKKGTNLATSFTMDRKALDHLQLLSLTDVAALLPGGKTNTIQNLATNSPQRFEINGYSGERGNATFGVALEVDGVRITNNAMRDGTSGPDIRNIAPSNVASVEIITGVPSVEYGDMTNGLVKINNRKGVSPYILEMSTRPNTKQVALSKGLRVGKDAGVINFNVDYSQSVANLASPYTTYNRNGLSLNYANTFNKKRNQPVIFNFGITGNVGGYNDENDPDLFTGTFEKNHDNAVRANFSVKWLLNKPWLTNVEISGFANYNNKLAAYNVLKSATSSTPSIRTKDEGYHVGQTYEVNPAAAIILIPKGFWYEKRLVDNRLINYNGRVKANWFKKIKSWDNNLLVGADYSVSGNNGRGTYYEDIRTAPTWREYLYSQESFMYNYAAYAEDALTIPLGKSSLQLVAGVRGEMTAISGSEYGNVSNVSPRANARYVVWQKADQLIEDLSVKVGWGRTVKLPGFDALYAVPTFRDIRTFEAATTASGETFYGYYTQPRTRLFNPDLKWQSNVQREIQISLSIAGHRIYLTAAQDKTTHPYTSNNIYEPFYYKFTDQKQVEKSAIPIADRIYATNQQTGIVTITDRSGVRATETLTYEQRYAFMSNGIYANGSPVTRNRLTWTVDFKQIRTLRTTLRVDGNYYFYKGLERNYAASMPNASQLMANGQPYKYIGFYVGGGTLGNGEINRSVDMNFTATTHIPAIRLVITARLEASFYKFSQNLSEGNATPRSVVLDGRDGYTPSVTLSDIYGGNRFVGTYPEYYTSLDDLNTRIPFMEKLLWAKTNDVALYNELAKMVVKNNYNYYFNSASLSNYYSANLGVTKEIGRVASISFFANNFFINMGKVRSSQTDSESSLFNSSLFTGRVPTFNYGASLRLKL